MFALCRPKQKNTMNLFHREHSKILPHARPAPIDLSVAEIRWQFGKLPPNGQRYHNGHNGEPIAYRKPPSFFRLVWSLTPYDIPFPQMGVPNTPLVISRISNGRIFATGHPIHFMFRSKVGFSGSAYWMALVPVGSNRWLWLAAILEYLNGHNLCN